MKRHHTQQLLVAFIDCENLSPAAANEIYATATAKGTVLTILIYGCKRTLKPWKQAIECYGMEMRRHGGGKNAADELIKADAWMWFEQHGITRFVFATNDGDFASCIRDLRSLGCTVFGIGGRKPARKLVKVCNAFVHIR